MTKVAIIGFGIDGQSALKYWQAAGAEVTICDQDTTVKVPQGINTQLGAEYLNDLDRFDVIMRSSGIHPKVILTKNPGVEEKITTVINEFLRICPTKNVVGVTGTKGKGTTCTLITKMLEASGKQAFLGGNYGISPFDFLPQLTDSSWVVLELSSYQLFDVKHSTHIAVCLMMQPEHLNWHSDEQDYIKAKTNLFANQQADDIAIYYAENLVSQQIASASPGRKIAYYDEPGAYIFNKKIMIGQTVLCETSELKLIGQHNWQNVCAAVTAMWQIEPNVEAIRSVLTTFSGLEHRLEFVREKDGVNYYDDSFGTIPETAVAAIEAFEQPKVIILGGSSKGAAFDQLAKAVAQHSVHQAILIGDTAPAIRQALNNAGFSAVIEGGSTMPEIVAAAKAAAKPGDVVLLSTGCASFGLFKDYKDRGNQFKAAVNAL
ncbi:MAG TPA: UDP-N-acetylmuramoyl-L-alanine--D-glutamate ligase [Patescibacteria group bacterium]|nr:UDP-N-acetylmuramoyl-L-alanine--D-glutamate ligase [Patescibacteria group bacterium]